MSPEELEERPSKRIRLSPDAVETSHQPTQNAEVNSNGVPIDGTKSHNAKELEVGIQSFINNSQRVFIGVLKKRYTDFMVNEILPNGQVLHLKNVKSTKEDEARIVQSEGNANSEILDASAKDSNVQPKVEESKKDIDNQEVSADDKLKLVEYFNEKAVDDLLTLYQNVVHNPQKKSRDFAIVRTEFTSDRNLRSQIHQDIRRIFNHRIDSSTDKDGTLVLSASRPNNKQQGQRPNSGANQSRKGKLGWLERGGEYLHFTLYKENKDTMEILSYLSRQMKTNAKTFQFAGTKDRRAVTAQRVSAFRVDAERLAAQNRSIRNAALGDFEYQAKGLDLGDLNGNEFVITLRECNFADQASTSLPVEERLSMIRQQLSKNLDNLHSRGFINYYGLQRFGTFANRTDTIGLKVLQGDFRGACDALLEFSPESLAAAEGSSHGENIASDDKARAEAINLWRTTGKVNEALDRLPRKFNAESTLIRHLGKYINDYVGALMMIPRNLRLMYVHAYQSLVWNLAAGERWRLYADRVVEGDLVLVHEHRDKEESNQNGDAENHMVDADGEIVIAAASTDRSHSHNDAFERARPLSASEAESGMYKITDIVLPQPGFDVEYPANDAGSFYARFMGSEAGGKLDPYNMRRKQKDFSLSGGYRKLIATIGAGYGLEVRAYANEDQQFVKTDLERLSEGESSSSTQVEEASGASTQDKIAVVLKFKLGSSTYATMALRELSNGGIQTYQTDFVGGR